MRARNRHTLLAVLGAFAALSAIALPSAALASARTGVDDFSYGSWDSVFDVALDGEGRAAMTVKETLVADFPQTDQNRGIVRGLAEKYGGAPLFPSVTSVTDGRGGAVPYETDSNDDVLFLSLGDDTYRHGPTTYVIDYTMRDVIHQPVNADIDEFYWDLLPLDSTQAIGRFHALIRFDDALTGAMLGAPSCYQGEEGSRDACTITKTDAGYEVSATDVPARSGVTVSFPFAKGTVVPSPALQPDALTDLVPYAVAGGGLLAAGGGLLAIRMLRRRHRAQGRGVIVAQYDVPADLPPLLAAEVLDALAVKRKATPAEIVHLGVRGTLRIEDGEEKPVLALVDPSIAPDPLDSATVKALFPDLEAGARVDLSEPDDELATRLAALPRSARDAAVERGLIERTRSVAGLVLGIVGILVVIAAAVLAFGGVVVERPAAIVAFVLSLIAGAFVIVIAVRLMLRTVVVTRRGAETWEYLQGVREYIRLAEADRIRMLQSYRGAERRSDGAVDVIVLYERLLPYAMLFGLEKEWGDVLSVTYERNGSTPGWYTGYAVGSLGSSLSSMGSSLSATPVATSSSSSSGSFGGGFSGGGGGGGFSGGR